MNLKRIESIEDLKKCGEGAKIKNELEQIVAPLKLAEDSYEYLLQVVVTLKQNWIDFVPGPFVSEQAEYIFYLTKMEGKQRNRALGITDKHYENKKTAQKWFKKISCIVHPDKSGDDDAFKILKSLYDIMVDDSFGDENE